MEFVLFLIVWYLCYRFIYKRLTRPQDSRRDRTDPLRHF